MTTQTNITSAFVLHTRPYRETSVLVDFFTQEFGRLSAIVRGVRKARSAYAGLLLPFLPLCVSFRGKTELLNVTTLEAEAGNTSYFLTNHALFCGLYANELLYHSLHRHDPYPTLFKHYQNLLQNLQKFSAVGGGSSNGSVGRQRQWTLFLFIKELLREIGYGLEWNKTAAGVSVEEAISYRFEFGLGFRAAEQFGHWDNIKGSSLLALCNGCNGNGNVSAENSMLAIDSIPIIDEIKKIERIFNIIFHHLLGNKFTLCQRVFDVVAGL